MKQISVPEVQPFETAHYQALRDLAPECMVLLKKNGDFPLASPCEIALYGAGARHTVKGGTGSGDVNVRHFTTVEQGLINAGFSIMTGAWLDAYDKAREQARAGFYESIIEESKRTGTPAFLLGLGKNPQEPTYCFPQDAIADVCLYILSRNSGEGADRPGGKGDLELSDEEERDIRACAARYKKFMLVLNVGGPVDISPVLNDVPNILLLSQLGSVTGDALADVLLGKTCPSGKLTSSWAKAQDYPALGDFGRQDDTRYREGIFVGYRYFEATGIKPLFPFGFGLGYTDFSTELFEFCRESAAVSVSVRVKNIGQYAGKETVQLYYSAPDGKLKKPLRELGAFAKTGEIQPGESETVTLHLPIENMASWDEETASWLLEKGEYVISVGDRAAGIILLETDITAAKLSHIGGAPDFTDWVPCASRTVPDGLPRIVFREDLSGHYDLNRIDYESMEKPDLSGISDDDLARVCVGKFKEGSGVASIIGNAAYHVAGAAGETADVISALGFGKMVLADGPAGVRVTTRYVEQPDGALGLDAGSFAEIIQLFSEPLQQFIRSKTEEAKQLAETETVYYHYASAIPIGTALAQAWNPAVPQTCGDLVGEEMELFGVNVWLAPALNIHRSPLCGRNFEYYSEDPLISGKTAAAMTQGVQKHEKCAVTIKHFAANNQETNRFGSNSMLSERALREIYLKGFEICVKEAAPKSLMTSYNLINGTHTANRYDLLTTVLRDEWGFDGFVMTDWGTTGSSLNQGKYGASSPALCIHAGNDLVMSGNQADVDGILDGLRNGIISRDELKKCACRVMAMAKKLS